jgi:hypothetical protein
VPSECAVTEDAETEQTEQVTFTIANLRAVEARDLFALLDVEVRVAGLSFWIMGVQGRRARNGGALIQLPTYRDTDGKARPAVVRAASESAPRAASSDCCRTRKASRSARLGDDLAASKPKTIAIARLMPSKMSVASIAAKR